MRMTKLTTQQWLYSLASLAEYDPDKEEWLQYATNLNHFFTVNAITEANKDIFLSMLGPQMFKLLSNLVAPAKP